MALPDIILVDDHDIYRDGLFMLFTLKKVANVIGQASNGLDFMDLLENNKPDIVIMDIAMPGMDGVKATELALNKFPDLNIIALSMSDNEEYYLKMINAGVKGFILKSSSKDELIKAVEAVSSGKSYFSDALLKNIMQKISPTGAKFVAEIDSLPFTKREMEILKLMCNGLSALEIAEELYLSKKTVEGHRTQLFQKTCTKNSVALVVYAIKNKVVYV